MKFSELYTKVVIETARPDLAAETKSAVLSSTLKMHGMDFFYKDILPYQVMFEIVAYIQTLDLQAIPRFRSFSWFRKYLPSLQASQLNPGILPPLWTPTPIGNIWTNPALKLLKFIAANDLFDDYGYEKPDVCYGAGGTFFIKSSTPLQYGLIGFYQWPNMLNTPDINITLDVEGKVVSGAPIAGTGANDYETWICREFPWAIIYDAASNVLQKIGQTDAARKYDQPQQPNGTTPAGGLVADHVRNLLISNVTPEGY